MKLNDRLIGALTIVAGIAVISGTFGFRDIPGQQFGSAFFPRIIGVALICTGFVQALNAAAGPAFTRPAWVKGQAVARIIAVLTASLVWLVLVNTLGFLLTTGLLVTTVSVIAGGRLPVSLGVGIVATGVLYTVFALLLRVPLPRGLLESWI